MLSAGCSGDGVSAPELTAPSTVKAGEAFELSGVDATTIRKTTVRATGSTESWVLVASGDSAPPTALPGNPLVSDSLDTPTGAVTLTFDSSTTPGSYKVCVPVSVGTSDDVEDVCVTISVEAPQ